MSSGKKTKALPDVKEASSSGLPNAIARLAAKTIFKLSPRLPRLNTPPSVKSPLANLQSTDTANFLVPAEANVPEGEECRENGECAADSSLESKKEAQDRPGISLPEYQEIQEGSYLGLSVSPPIAISRHATDPHLQACTPPITSNPSFGVASSTTMSPSSSYSERTPRALSSTPLPLTHICTEELTHWSERPFFRGVYSEVYKANWKGQMVAVKVIRCLNLPEGTMQRKKERELRTWSELRHPSILPLLGFVEDVGHKGELGALVSPYRPRGNAITYLKTLQHKHRERITLWHHVLEGVSYLHGYTPIVIHGDIKPVNIVIDDNLRAQICDFGLAQLIIENGQSGLTTTTPYTGTIRYKSRELVVDPTEMPTIASDVYALGCLGLQFVFGEAPYVQLKSSPEIEMAIRNGTLPAERPSGLTGEISNFWDKLQECWDPYPEGRPFADLVSQYAGDRGDALAQQVEREGWGSDV